MTRSNNRDSPISKANLAFENGCRNVIERARRFDTAIVICRDGKIVELSPDEATKELEANLAKREKDIPF